MDEDSTPLAAFLATITAQASADPAALYQRSSAPRHSWPAPMAHPRRRNSRPRPGIAVTWVPISRALPNRSNA